MASYKMLNLESSSSWVGYDIAELIDADIDNVWYGFFMK